MSMFPFSLLFSSTLILSSMIALSASNWLMMWTALELNMMSFIPLLYMSDQTNQSEASFKYFLSQAIGSGLFLTGAICSILSSQSILPMYLFHLSIMLGLMIKLGLPPCHFWFPSVMSNISWPMCLLLSTWQKIIPLFTLIFWVIPIISNSILLFIVLSSTLSALGGISQTQMKPLLAYSSIGHMSWMIAASSSSVSTAISYFLIYSIISSSLIISLFFFNSFYINSFKPLTLLNKSMFFCLIVSIFSLAGVPPFLGFFPKWLVIQELSHFSMSITFFLLLGSMINLYYYLNIIFTVTLNLPSSVLINNTPMKQPNLTLIIMSSLTLMNTPLLLFMFYAMTLLN